MYQINKPKNVKGLAVTAIALVLTNFSIAVNAAEETQPNEATSAEISNSDRGSLKAYIDPKTGELTSAPESDERDLPVSTDNATDAELYEVEESQATIITREDGVTEATIEGGFRVPQTATLDCDGKVVDLDHAASESSKPHCGGE